MHPQRQADVLACGPQSTFLETLEVSPSRSGTSMVTPSWPPAPPRARGVGQVSQTQRCRAVLRGQDQAGLPAGGCDSVGPCGSWGAGGTTLGQWGWS